MPSKQRSRAPSTSQRRKVASTSSNGSSHKSSGLVAERGRRYANLAELKTAVRRFAVSELARHWNTTEADVERGPLRPSAAPFADHREREAREIFERLHAAVRDAATFAETHGNPEDERGSFVVPGLGLVGNRLVSWAKMFAGSKSFAPSPLASQILAPLEAPQLPSADAELTNLVRWWVEEISGVRPSTGRPPESNRVIALRVLRGGWWPERMTKPPTETTVAEVVDLARRSVKQVRTGK